MKILLDTHVFLWAIAQPQRLSTKVRKYLESDHGPLISVASLWEIALKVQAGKLQIVAPSRLFEKSIVKLKGIGLPVRTAHVIRTFDLPDHHKDPFDRLLIAQALE